MPKVKKKPRCTCGNAGYVSTHETYCELFYYKTDKYGNILPTKHHMSDGTVVVTLGTIGDEK